MISISAAATVILYLVVGGIVFALLLYAVNYCEKEFPSTFPWYKMARVLLVLLAVFVVIGILLSVVGGQPIFRP